MVNWKTFKGKLKENRREIKENIERRRKIVKGILEELRRRYMEKILEIDHIVGVIFRIRKLHPDSSWRDISPRIIAKSYKFPEKPEDFEEYRDYKERKEKEIKEVIKDFFTGEKIPFLNLITVKGKFWWKKSKEEDEMDELMERMEKLNKQIEENGRKLREVEEELDKAEELLEKKKMKAEGDEDYYKERREWVALKENKKIIARGESKKEAREKAKEKGYEEKDFLVRAAIK